MLEMVMDSKNLQYSDRLLSEYSFGTKYSELNFYILIDLKYIFY